MNSIEENNRINRNLILVVYLMAIAKLNESNSDRSKAGYRISINTTVISTGNNTKRITGAINIHRKKNIVGNTMRKGMPMAMAVEYGYPHGYQTYQGNAYNN